MLRPVLAVFIFATWGIAQTPPCLSLNDANNSVSSAISSFGFAGPAVSGYQITPATTQLIRSGQLFTGNTSFAPGFETLEIWDEDPATSLPGARIAGGTWQIAPALGVAWQGANFDQLVIMLQGVNYWIVWIDPGFSRLAYEPGGVAVPTARRSGTTWTLQGASEALKVRLFCNYLDGAAVTPFGLPCQTGSGRLGAAFTNEVPNNGNLAFKIEGTGFPAGTLAVFLIGWNPTFVSQTVPGMPAGCLQHTDILTSLFGITGTGTVRASLQTGASGHVTYPFQLPANPGFVGVFFGSQIVAFDAALTSPLQFAVSNGLRFTIQ